MSYEIDGVIAIGHNGVPVLFKNEFLQETEHLVFMSCCIMG